MSALIPVLPLLAAGAPLHSVYLRPKHGARQGQIAKRFSLPPDAGAWLLRIVIAGGYLGRKGSLIVTSEGAAAAGRNYPYACTAKLTAEEMRQLNQLVAAATFGGPGPAGEWPRSRGADTIVVRVELQRREDEDTASMFSASWDDTEERTIPDSLLALRRAMAGLEKKVIAKCSSYR